MKPVMTSTIANEILEALGLPANIQSIDLHFHANDIVRATVQYVPEREQLVQVVSILKRYELHEREDDARSIEVSARIEIPPIDHADVIRALDREDHR